MKQIVVLVCLCSVLLSCHKVERPKKPENLIAKDKMVDILFDVFVFSAAKGTDRRVLEENNVTPDVYIYEKYKIDSMQFVLSNEYYAYDVKEYEIIISEVEARLQAKKLVYENEIEKEEERRKKRLDSIEKLGKKNKKNRTFQEEKKDSL